ncbi:hypothetical protein HPB50_014463 [Hyalomma asiaticum]|uniref:Uncharacterized protein n=1 Tax=Hyalomma asiaticum TaxID=266040 RepID=A0ACB7T5A3_HYAAI|nr:hypothetical protein HPB50_014463 [Hyalomma asiaticum]
MSRIPKAQQLRCRSNPQACFDLQKKEPALSMDLIKLARKSGQLNLTGRGMIDVPDQVWNINNLTEEERRGLSLSLDQCDGDRWWDQADLTKLYLSANKLSSLSADIEKLQALTILERGTVHLLKWLQDRLGESPEGAAHKRLSGGASLNDGSDLIESIEKFALKTTHALELSKRSLNDVPEEIFKMAAECDANTIDLSKNALETVPKGLEAACPVMTELNLSFNKLTALPGFLCLATRLTFLDLRNNQLSDLPGEMSVLSNVRELNLSFNRFSRIPEVVTSWESLEILFASDNKIEELDMTRLQKLKQIAVLDLRNNSILQVPPELGNMRQLRNLQLEGNPFRNPRPAILSKGTQALLEFLRDRIPR